MPKILTVLLALFTLSACDKPDQTYRFSGSTMGTTYNIVIISKDTHIRAKAQTAIKSSLKYVNRHLNNWNKDSEISRFNRSNSTAPIKIGPSLLQIMHASNIVHEQSNGFFDTTLDPIIDLWGFGPIQAEKKAPSATQIKTMLTQIGQSQQLELNSEDQTLKKRHKHVTINLSAIAKGYGIDKIAESFEELNIENFMIEIGGDLLTRGENPYGQDWRIGIEQPDSFGKDLQKIVTVSNLAMATSGDYRNYFEESGKRYSHIIDPHTGYPIKHKTVSVSVLAQNAMYADAWATALLALGQEEGRKIAEKYNIAAFFISHSHENSFITSASTAFNALQTD